MVFSKILVPVDLTEKTAKAVEVARDLVAAEGDVVLLHVIEQLDTPFEEMNDFYEKLAVDAQVRMQEHVERLSEGGVRARAAIRIGKRAREIARFSHDEDFDLMVLYSHRLDPADLSHAAAGGSETEEGNAREVEHHYQCTAS